MLCPEWMDIVDCNWSFYNLSHLFGWNFLNSFLSSIFFLNFFCNSVLYKCIKNCIFFCNFFLRNLLSLFTRIFVSYKDWNWHERAVFIKNFFSLIFVGKFIAVFIEVKSNLCTRSCFSSLIYIIFSSAIT